jgi:hypothetical protein
MRPYIVLLTFLFTNVKTVEHENAINPRKRQLTEIQSYLDKQLLILFKIHARKILESPKINRMEKKILKKYLIIRLVRMKQKLIEMALNELEKKKKTSGNYMHWRHG